ncbi:MAG: DUF4013 domain-containing protein [Deltaproteobacteria bacterium]|nr:DUF4013 domain-containing protein [Candidatus Zymogenaceae bacterium]
MALDIGKALKFPLNDENWIVKVLIGTVLMIIPIVNFIPIGYVYNIFKKVLNKEEPVLAEWEGWGDLFVRGLMVFLIMLVYIIVPWIIMMIGVGIMSAGASNESGALTGLGGFVMFIGGLLYLVVALLVPFALAHYAKNNEEFGAIFKFGDIIGNFFKAVGDYLLAIVVMIGIFFVLGIIGIIPILGWIVGILAIFYVSVVMYTLLAMAIQKAYEVA